MNVEASRSWATAGPAGGDTAYRTQSLKFVPLEYRLDESVSLRALFDLWLRAAMVSLIIYGVLFIVWLFGAVGAIAAATSDSSTSDAGSGISAGLLLATFLIPMALFWVLLLLPRTEEPIAEWRTLLEGKAGAATSAYATIYGSLVRRRIPVNAAAMRIRSDVLGREVVNNRLVISERSYQAFVTVFPYGTSLYVGWSMYRTRRGAVLIGIFFKDLAGSIVGRAGLINQMLRTEKVRAMREALHSAVREGVDIAVEGIEVPLAATFGHDVPVQDLGAIATPAPIPSQGYSPYPAYPNPEATGATTRVSPSTQPSVPPQPQ